jgi:hypothetical protein
LAALSVGGKDLTDKCVPMLAKLMELEVLVLWKTSITDGALGRLKV